MSKRDNRLSQADILDAFRRAIVVTQTTVEAESPAAADLSKMLDLTTKMQADAEAAEALLERVLGRAGARAFING